MLFVFKMPQKLIKVQRIYTMYIRTSIDNILNKKKIILQQMNKRIIRNHKLILIY